VLRGLDCVGYHCCRGVAVGGSDAVRFKTHLAKDYAVYDLQRERDDRRRDLANDYADRIADIDYRFMQDLGDLYSAPVDELSPGERKALRVSEWKERERFYLKGLGL
jgi:hypothetical protein